MNFKTAGRHGTPALPLTAKSGHLQLGAQRQLNAAINWMYCLAANNPESYMIAIASVSEFVAQVLKQRTTGSRAVVFRGHSDATYVLSASIFRRDFYRTEEHNLVRELLASQPDDFASDRSALEILVRMQHFSFPTRLLDVSFNPLVALYFAVQSDKKRKLVSSGSKNLYRQIEPDGEVVVLSVNSARVKYFDSDTVSCLTNLARLPQRLRLQISKHVDAYVANSIDRDAFNQGTAIHRLVHAIRQEKVGFEADLNPSDLLSIVLVKPKQNNRRIIAQAGAFFAFGINEVIEDDNLDSIKISRMQVRAESKTTILGELDKLGINEKTLFPDLEKVGRYLTGSLAARIIQSN